jgi:hypothetical protein
VVITLHKVGVALGNTFVALGNSPTCWCGVAFGNTFVAFGNSLTFRDPASGS